MTATIRTDSRKMGTTLATGMWEFFTSEGVREKCRSSRTLVLTFWTKAFTTDVFHKFVTFSTRKRSRSSQYLPSQGEKKGESCRLSSSMTQP